MHAGAIMTLDPVTVRPETPAHEALRLLTQHDIRHLPVLVEGRLVGMLSERDLRGLIAWDPEREAFAAGTTVTLQTPVAAVMSTGVLSVTVDAELEEVIDLFLDHRVGALPVVDAGSDALLGIISTLDVLRVLRDPG